MRCWRGYVVAVVLISMSGCTKGASNGASPSTDTESRSKPAPIRLLDLDGQRVDIWKDASPAVTVVLFTRTDCPIANRSAPEIQRLYEKYHSGGVEFVLVYVDPGESPAVIRRHLQEYSFSCRAARDPHHDLVAFCHATATPEAIVFDKNRKVTYQGRVDDRYVDLGQPRAQPTAHDLADAIEATVLGLPVVRPRTKAIGCLIADLKD